jgi:DNA-3-methyladenine glycosylase II
MSTATAKATRAAHRVLKADPVMAALIAAAGPFRPRPVEDRTPFEALTRAIAHQQLHGVAAERILARFVGLSGSGEFPLPQQVLDADPERLRGVGFSYAKIAALKDLAGKTLSGVVPAPAEFACLTDEQIIERLTAVRGIGRWTAEMLLMFQLQCADVLPVDDFGIRNGFRLAYRLSRMPTARALAQFGERWKPYRSMAAWYLWRAVDLSRLGRLPRCAQPPRIALQAKAKAKHKAKAKANATASSRRRPRRPAHRPAR